MSYGNGMQTRLTRNGMGAETVFLRHFWSASCMMASVALPGRGCGWVGGCESEEGRGEGGGSDGEEGKCDDSHTMQPEM